MSNYSLQIYPDDPLSVNNKIVLNLSDSTKDRIFDYNNSKIFQSDISWFHDLLILFDSLNFHKEIYKPGYIYIKINIKGSRDVASIIKAFKHSTVNLAIGAMPIANGYKVLDIHPRLASDAKDSLYVELKAYSPDRYMMLNTNCASYTGKSISEIFDSELSRFKAMTSIDNKTKLVVNLQHMTGKMIPYAVQYNECTYDFLARLSNRYGEFMYYEGESLYLGLAESVTTIDIDNYVSVDYNYTITDNFSENIYNNYIDQRSSSPNFILTASEKEEIAATVENEADKETKDAAIIQAETSNRIGSKDVINSKVMAYEYLSPIKKSEIYKFEDYFNIKLAWPKLLAASLLESSLGEKAVASAVNSAVETTSAVFMLKTKNKQYNERIGGETIYPGVIYNNSTINAADKGTDLEFCSKIGIYQAKAANEKIEIDLGNNVYPNLILGSVVQINNAKCIVTTIKGCNFDVIGAQTTGTQITVIPYNEESANIGQYPYMIQEQSSQTSKPQTAVVVDNVDPNRLGRVRIRYPWQPVNSATDFKASIADASPWIRLSMPMASNNHGFNFLPEIGDEVMVNYEDGNIERPYIEGSLYNAKHNPFKTAEANHLKSITSTNGHAIKFYDNPYGNNVFTKIIPGLDLINKLIPGYMSINDPQYNLMSGYVEISDRLGLYSVKMSSDERKVSINSTYGDVEIGAMTGITISAPNGDVKIKGKNIKLEAGNNVTIVSGTNVKTLTDFSPSPKTFGGKFKKIVKTYAPIVQDAVIDAGLKKVVDLSYLRIIFEIFLHPVGGTMTLKSNRYLCLEAGQGKAQIINDNYRKNARRGNYLEALTLGIYERAAVDYDNHVYKALVDTKAFLDELCVANTKRVENEKKKRFRYRNSRNTVLQLGVANSINISYKDHWQKMINLDVDVKKAFDKITNDVYPPDIDKDLKFEKKPPFDKNILAKIDNLHSTMIKHVALSLNEMNLVIQDLVPRLKAGNNKVTIYEAATKIFKDAEGYKAKLAMFLGVDKTETEYEDVVDNKLFEQVYTGNAADAIAARRAVMAQVFMHVVNRPKDYHFPQWADYEDFGLIHMAEMLPATHSNFIPEERPKGAETITSSKLEGDDIKCYQPEVWADAISELKQTGEPKNKPGKYYAALRYMGDSINKNSGLKEMFDQNVWDQSNTGEILISKDKDSTFHFNETGIQKFKAAEYDSKNAEIKDILK